MSSISRNATKLGRMYTNGTKSYFSVTTILNGLYAKGKFFDTWLKNLGHFADIFTKAKQQRGTFVHEILHIMKSDPLCVVDRPYLHDMIHEYMDSVSIQFFHGKNSVVDSVMKYIESYQKWHSDYKITYLGSEVMLFHPELDWAGAVDDPIINHTLGHNMICDIKTGGAYDTHVLQCVAYALLWNKIYPKHKMTAVGILYIKDEYTKAPTYKFESLELDSPKGKKAIEQWGHTMKLWRLKYAHRAGTLKGKKWETTSAQRERKKKSTREIVETNNHE